MGKTYKSGYMSLHHSFNSLYNFQCKKKENRRKRKLLYKKTCYWMINDCDKTEILNMSITNLSPKTSYNNIKRPYRIGYCTNTNITYQEIINDNLPNEILDSISCKYENHKKMFDQYIYFKNLNENEKIDYLINNIKTEKKNIHPCYCNVDSYHLNNIKKQLKRRGNIGYFKGHR